MARESFQFRGTIYHVDDVIGKALEKALDPGFKEWCNGLITKNVALVVEPDWGGNVVELIGRQRVEQQWHDDVSRAKKVAVTQCINKIFGGIIGGGCTNNPNAPESVEAIDKAVIEKTLYRIRAIRQGTVHRNYGNR